MRSVLELPEFEQRRVRTIAAIFSLLIRISPFYPETIKVVPELSSKLRANGTLWTQTQMNAILADKQSQISYARLLKLAVPYSLFELFRAPGVYAEQLLRT